jgi:heme-degrading monooxygenase HmoA
LHARVVTLRVREGKIDEVLRIIREISVPVGERQEGFNGFVVKSDWGANKILITSLWNTEADMLAGESGEYFQDQISRVVILLAGPPLIEHYRVDIVS